MTLVQTFLNFALLFNSEQISVILLISSKSSLSVRGFLIGGESSFSSPKPKGILCNLALDRDNDELKQIVKENVKAALSENTQVISLAFTTLLQTLKANPKMVNSIYAISLTNANDRRHNDNDDNDNAIKYIEINKDGLSDLAEKNYENPVETLTNNSIANASSSPKPALQPSSSIFQNPSNQSDIYLKEESEIYDNSKGDVAD